MGLLRAITDDDPVTTLSDWAGVAAVLGALVVIWWPVRMAIAQRTEQRFEAAHPRNADGIIIGAEPILLRGVRPGAVLVLHGYNDSPQAVSALSSALHDAGWTVHAPVLPGHARTLPAFARSGAAEWMGAAREAYRALRTTHDRVAICGMSMGGALALWIAAEEPDVRAVVGIAPYLHLSKPMEALLLLTPIAALGARFLSGAGGRSVHDPEAARAIIAYRRSTPRLLRQLAIVTRAAFNALPSVLQPVLVIQSREDNRIPAESAARAFARIGSNDKTLDWVTGAGHVLTVDFGHTEMERRIIGWLDVHLG